MSQNELYHSDIYLGEDYSDGIKHYKYLKKVKSASGKWRYIYDESDLKNVENNINTINKAITNKDGYIKYTNAKGDYVSKKGNTTITVYGNGKQTNKDKFKERAITEIDKMTKKHKTQKIKDIPKRIISRGIGFVNKILLNIENKWIK